VPVYLNEIAAIVLQRFADSPPQPSFASSNHLGKTRNLIAAKKVTRGAGAGACSALSVRYAPFPDHLVSQRR
jgi:hypothetical protein